MNPQDLIQAVPSGDVPAPYWFVELFKVLGFTLHMVPMNLWYAGLLVALWLHWRGGEHGRTFAARLGAQMPVIIALGINLGIVPLLFIQLAYFRVFYSATILTAWHWMSIVVLLIPAYHGAYSYAFGLRGQMTARRRVAGWVSALLLVVIGALMVNGLSLMTNVAAWPKLFQQHSVDGAVLGTANNMRDVTFAPRWLLMLGLAIGTTGVWAVVDAAWFAARLPDAYRRWVLGLAKRLCVTSVVWVAIVGSWYVFFTWPPAVRDTMLGFPGVLLTLVTGGAVALPAVLLFFFGERVFVRSTALLLGVAQFAVLGLNAISRQIVQNLELRPYLDVASQPVSTQWGPLVLFLVLFVVGLGVIAWMVAQVVKAERSAAS